jgi:hypothetical protein
MGGSTSYSTVIAVLADAYPSSMTTPTMVETHPYNITVAWTALTTSANGGDIPIFYLLQWQDYTNLVWTNLTTDGVTGLIF